ncbi:MAG: N-acetylmuramoyl-L-alanine amidase [Firmicutes bacterium]|nr:N-acetylmuramoyl-L-alanine amidase [Bacillota bacterium]
MVLKKLVRPLLTLLIVSNFFVQERVFGKTIPALKDDHLILMLIKNKSHDPLLRINKNISAKIVIDPGHGGKKTGAVSGNRFEKDDNLDIALVVRDKLSAWNQEVIMTRNEDIDVSLEERSDISNSNYADLFVSIHRNAYSSSSVCGVEIFVMIDSPQINEYYANNVQKEIVRIGVQRDRGVKHEDFSVLRKTNAIAILIELGFITNEMDNSLFDQNLEAYAEAITYGIIKSIYSHYGALWKFD